MGNVQTGCLLCSPSGEQSSLNKPSSEKDRGEHEFEGLPQNECRLLAEAAVELERQQRPPSPTHVVEGPSHEEERSQQLPPVRVPSLSIELNAAAAGPSEPATMDEDETAGSREESFGSYYCEHFAPPLANATFDLYAKFPAKQAAEVPAAVVDHCRQESWPSPFAQYYKEHFPQATPGDIDLYAKFARSRSSSAFGSASKVEVEKVAAVVAASAEDEVPAAARAEASIQIEETASLPRPSFGEVAFSQNYAEYCSSLEHAPVNLYSGFNGHSKPAQLPQAAPPPTPWPSAEAGSFGAYYLANFPMLVPSEVHAQFAARSAATPSFEALTSADHDLEMKQELASSSSPAASDPWDFANFNTEDLDVTRPVLSPDNKAIEEHGIHEEEYPRLMIGAHLQAVTPSEGMDFIQKRFGEDSPAAKVATLEQECAAV